MSRFLFPLLLVLFSGAHAQMVTVECSDGQAEFAQEDLQNSKCLTITQLKKYYVLPLKGVDSKTVSLFIKLSKLPDNKIFAFIDSLNPDAFRIFDYSAKYLRVYHEFDVLFKYKYLKDGLPAGDAVLQDFVASRYAPIQFVEDSKLGYARWQKVSLLATYLPEFSSFKIPDNASGNDIRAFFVLIDFYQTVMKKPLPVNTDFLKNVFNNFDAAIQKQLIDKNLVAIK